VSAAPWPLDAETGQPTGCPVCGESPPTAEDGHPCAHPLHLPDLDPSRPYFPDVVVPLVGEDGNAFLVMGRTVRVLQRAGVEGPLREAFRAEFRQQQSYEAALGVVERWVEVS
jgi:hypothetical protein